MSSLSGPDGRALRDRHNASQAVESEDCSIYDEAESPGLLKYQDCAICEQIWHVLTTGGDGCSGKDLGSISDVMATECPRHKPLLEQVKGSGSEEDDRLFIWSTGRGKVLVSYLTGRPDILGVREYWLVRKPEVSDHPGIARTPHPLWINLDLAKTWFAGCKSEHNQCAVPFAKWQVSIRPTWLIDVQTRSLVPGDNGADYLTLSYLWGDNKGLQYGEGTLERLQQHNALNDPMIASQLSPIVEHAIEVVSLLGERYLWVDNLCIPQNMGSTEELQNMGAIYANATLAIIAMDDNGPKGLVGLKGISSSRTLRNERNQCTSFGDEVFIPAQGSLRVGSDARFINYHTRAWTFQEFEMSRRRLIMKDGYMYWMCRTSALEENCHDDIQSIAGISDSIPHILRGFPSSVSLEHVVQSYSNRELTYEEDTLPAISGILTTLSGTFEGGFLCGIPEACFEAGLCWNDSTGVGLIRRVSSNRPLSDRLHPSHLPSWSWIGWRGDITGSREIDEADRLGWGAAYETSAITNWYSFDVAKPHQMRKIESTWLSSRNSHNEYGSNLPSGWTRHEMHPIPSPSPVESAGMGTLQFHPSNRVTHVYRHVDMSQNDLSWLWPFPVRHRTEVGTPPVTPEQLPNIRCATSRAYVLGYLNHEDSAINRHAQGGLKIDQLVHLHGNATDRIIGILHPDIATYRKSFPSSEAGWDNGKSIEVVAICRRTRYARRWPGIETTITEIYAVLWIEWKGAVAYRLGYGEVEKDAWEALPLEEIDLILG